MDANANKGVVWLGTAGWSYLPDWVGSFYPAGTSASQALERYVEAFPFVEVDSTFYAAPALSTIERWGRIFPAGFRASFKAPKELVQDTMLRVPEVPFGHFCGSIADQLQARLAMIVVQMQPSFHYSPANFDALRQFVSVWADRFPIGVELRHLGWRNDETLGLLADHGVVMVSNDLHDVPDLERAVFDTSDYHAYIRLIGRHDGIGKDRIARPQTEARAWWADQIATLIERGARHVYVVVNNHYEGHAPATLRTMMTELAARGVPLTPAQGWPNGQVTLF